MNSKKIGLKLIILLIILLFTCSIPATSQYCSFEGATGSFELMAEEGKFELDASKFRVTMNQTLFGNIKDIIVTRKDGTVYNRGASEIQVNYKENINWGLPGTHLEATFNNVTFKKSNEHNNIIIEGDVNKMWYSHITSLNENINIDSFMTSSVFVNDKEISDFKTIQLVVDDESYIQLLSNQIEIAALEASDFFIYSASLEKATINSNGILRLNNHKYSVEIIDKIELSNSLSSSFRVTDEELKIKGEIKSAFLNDKDIMTNDLSYWFDQKTDKINALSSFIIAIATVVLVIITYIQVKYSSKVTEQNDKNIEFALNAQKREHIQKQLHQFYYPLSDFLEGNAAIIESKDKDDNTIKSLTTIINIKDNDYKNYTQYNKIVAHQYLARANTKSLLNQFITFLYKRASSTNPELLSVFENLETSIKEDINKLNDELEGLINLE